MQFPAKQTLKGKVHTIPQSPQLFGSLVRSVQVPSQSVKDGGQAQVPPWHTVPPVHETQSLQCATVHLSMQNWQHGESGDCPQDWEQDAWHGAQQSSQQGTLLAGYRP
jgi:hypothetical protein